MTRRLILILVIAFQVTSCDSQKKSTIDVEFVTSKGFQQSPKDPESYILEDVTLKDASQRLGFSMDEIKPSDNVFINTWVVKIDNKEFHITPEFQRQNDKVIQKSIDPKVKCSISVHLKGKK